MSHEKKHSVGKAALRGSVRKATVLPSKRGKPVSVHRTYTISEQRHDYNVESSKALRNGIQSERIRANDAVGGTRTQRRIIKTEGKTDRIRRGVSSDSLRVVEKRSSIRINGREVGTRIATGAKRGYQVGKSSIRGVYSQAAKSNAAFGTSSESDRAATETGAYISGTASRTGRTVGKAVGKIGSGDHRIDAKIGQIEKRLEENGKKLYKADKRLGRNVKVNNMVVGRKDNDSLLRGQKSGSLRQGLFLRTDRRVLRAANQKTALVNTQQNLTQKLELLRKKKGNPVESLMRRLTIGAAVTFLAVLAPLIIVILILSGMDTSGGNNIQVQFNEDTAIVASYLYDNRKEIFPDDGKKGEYDILRMTAVLSALAAQTSKEEKNISISHLYSTTELGPEFKGKEKQVKGSGWQGLCGWSNEEMAAFIQKEQDAGRYAGYEEGTNVADLYTQCHYLKEKLIKLKNNKKWKKAKNAEEAAIICYDYLILQKEPGSLELDFSDVQNRIDGSIWSVLYTMAYQWRLQDYDTWALELAALDYDSPSGRGKTCYPTSQSREYDKRLNYVVPVTLPRLTTVTGKNEEGEIIETPVETAMTLQCHWLIASRLYESFYEAAQKEYLLSESCSCFTPDSNNPDSIYSYGLAFSINQGENTPDENGECHASKWGSVIDEDLAKIFQDHGFYWSLENEPPGPRWEFRFIKQMPDDYRGG